jgi:hypothetical protein
MDYFLEPMCGASKQELKDAGCAIFEDCPGCLKMKRKCLVSKHTGKKFSITTYFAFQIKLFIIKIFIFKFLINNYN